MSESLKIAKLLKSSKFCHTKRFYRASYSHCFVTISYLELERGCLQAGKSHDNHVVDIKKRNYIFWEEHVLGYDSKVYNCLVTSRNCRYWHNQLEYTKVAHLQVRYIRHCFYSLTANRGVRYIVAARLSNLYSMFLPFQAGLRKRLDNLCFIRYFINAPEMIRKVYYKIGKICFLTEGSTTTGTGRWSLTFIDPSTRA